MSTALISVGALKVGDWVLVCDAPNLPSYEGERVFPRSADARTATDCVFAPVLNIYRDTKGDFQIEYGFGDQLKRHDAPEAVVVISTEVPPATDPAETERSAEDTHELTVLINKLREAADEIADSAEQAQKSADCARSEAENAESYADDAFTQAQALIDQIGELRLELLDV